jgi:hypothetical protein
MRIIVTVENKTYIIQAFYSSGSHATRYDPGEPAGLEINSIKVADGSYCGDDLGWAELHDMTDEQVEEIAADAEHPVYAAATKAVLNYFAATMAVTP